MRSLFFKIFIIFWIAQTLIFLISTALILARRFPRPASLLDPAFSSLRTDASQGIRSFDAGGCAGFERFSQHRGGAVALVDLKGQIICGDSVIS